MTVTPIDAAGIPDWAHPSTCPRAHVALAQHARPTFTSAEQAPEGQTDHLSEAEFLEDVRQRQTVLCRRVGPLVQLATTLNAQGVPARLKLDPVFCDELRVLTLEVFSRPYLPLSVRQHLRAQAKSIVLQGEARRRRMDQLHVLWVLAQALGEVTPLITGAGLLTWLDGVLELDGTLLLSDLHGIERKTWQYVTLWHPECFTTLDTEQERQLLLLALTRSRNMLRFVYGKDAWNAGRLVLSPSAGAWMARPESELTPAQLAQRALVKAAQAEMIQRYEERQKARHVQVPPAQVEDVRPLSLFGGTPDLVPVSVVKLIRLMSELYRQPRLAMQTWLAESLEILRQIREPLVMVNGTVLAQLQSHVMGGTEVRFDQWGKLSA